MYTFIENYSRKNYTGEDGIDCIIQFIMDQLNTQIGTRPYYPDYGTNFTKYRFLPATIENARMLHTDVYSAITNMNGITIKNSDFSLEPESRKVNLSFTLIVNKNSVTLRMSYSDGLFTMN